MSNGDPNVYSTPPFQPQPSPKSNTGLIVLIVAAVVAIPMMLVCIGILIALLLPAVQSAREAARRMQCSNNEKQIVLALRNYESAYKSYPPAYTVDAQGNRLHSWRTLILPFLEQKAVYDQIDLDKPWDDPLNLPFANLEIPTYVCSSAPTAPTMTTYVAVVDPSGVFTGPVPTKMDEVLDGTSNTLLITEVVADRAVPWMSPNDITLNAFLNNPATTGSHHRSGRNVATADGAVFFLSSQTDPAEMQALVGKDDGQTTTINN